MNDNVHVNVPVTVPGMSPDYTHPKFQKYLQETVAEATRTAAEAVDYPQVMRSFDHSSLASSPSYRALRLALDCVARESGESAPEMTLAGFLDAVRDMAITAVYADMCDQCTRACHRAGHEHPDDEWPRACNAYKSTWPHAAERKRDRMLCRYKCESGHEYTVNWAVDLRNWNPIE